MLRIVFYNARSAIYLKLFKQFDWQQVALLAEDGQDFPQYHRYLHDMFVNNDVAVVYRRKILSRFSDADITAVCSSTCWTFCFQKI